MFGRVFDRSIILRIFYFVRPYQRQLILSIIAVLVFTGTQIAIPLIIGYAIDNGLGADIAGQSARRTAAVDFAVAFSLNYGSAWMQESVAGKAAENVLFHIRTAMFGHLQDVSLSFMDKTEVGRCPACKAM